MSSKQKKAGKPALVWIYLREKLPSAVLPVVFAAVFAVIFALYGLPAAAAGYPALVCVFVWAVAACVGYGSWCRRHKLMLGLKSEVTQTLDGVPAPRNQAEADERMLLEAVFREKNAVSSQLEQRYRDTTEYFGLWAHQIKTPIAAMRLVLQEEEETPAGRELAAQLQAVEQYVEMAMCYLRLDASTTDFVIRTCALDAIIRQAVKKYAAQFIRRHIRLDYTPLDVQVLTDEKGLYFIVDQILSNALKYTRPGGTIRIYMEDTALCIADTGIGIAPEDVPRVFERGYTGLNGHEDKRASGIGLYLCSRIAQQLGHTLSLTSQAGAGTTVRIGLDRPKFRAE